MRMAPPLAPGRCRTSTGADTPMAGGLHQMERAMMCATGLVRFFSDLATVPSVRAGGCRPRRLMPSPNARLLQTSATAAFISPCPPVYAHVQHRPSSPVYAHVHHRLSPVGTPIVNRQHGLCCCAARTGTNWHASAIIPSAATCHPSHFPLPSHTVRYKNPCVACGFLYRVLFSVSACVRACVRVWRNRSFTLYSIVFFFFPCPSPPSNIRINNKMP
jgi:hypothetical protein